MNMSSAAEAESGSIATSHEDKEQNGSSLNL
jgi:hypothetical protein